MRTFITLVIFLCLSLSQAFGDTPFADEVSEILESSLPLDEKQILVQQSYDNSIQNYLINASNEFRDFIRVSSHKIKNTKIGLMPLYTEGDAPVLLIQGLTNSPQLTEWVKSIELLRGKNKSIYYFAWSKSKSLKFTQKELAKSIQTLLNKYQEKRLSIIGYSSGGVIGLLALKDLAPEIQERIELHTVASGYYGYQAPKLAYIAVPFVGIGSIEMGRGQAQALKDVKLNSLSLINLHDNGSYHSQF